MPLCGMFRKLGQSSLDIYVWHYFIVCQIPLRQLGAWFEASGNLFLEFLLLFAMALVVCACCMAVGYVVKNNRFLCAVLYGRWDSRKTDD